MLKKYIRKRIRALKRWSKRPATVLPFVAAVVLVLAAGYAGYMNERRLSVNPESYKPLLNLIGKAESGDNYNAHFGKPKNTEVPFTEMTIAEVLRWQDEFVNQGSPSSAVGRYQIINTTLNGLVRELQIDQTQKFDQPTQDRMAIALLKRRGSERYVNQEITGEEFAASLAKEWAALPKTIGENPSDSYYAGDGLNKALVKTNDLLKAIEPIKPAR